MSPHHRSNLRLGVHDHEELRSMQRAVSWEPVLDSPRTGVRDLIVALLGAALAAALVVPVLTHTWPHSLLPPPSAASQPDYAYNLRLLKLMLLMEGAGVAGLALLVGLRGAWLRRVGGVAVLEAHAGLGLALLFALHVLALLFYFPPEQILSAEPVHTGSHAANFYRIFAAHQLLSRGGHLWGYDPFFMSGYPAGAVFDPDARGAEIFAHAFAFLGLPFATKAYILIVQACVPLLLYASARLLGLRRGPALLAAFLGVLHWHWGRPFLGYLRWAGMHSYLLASLLALLGTGLAVRFFDRNHRVRILCWAGLVAVGALLGFVQPEGLLLLAPGVGIAYAIGGARLRRRDHAALVAALLFLVALHSTWFLPLVRQRHLLVPASAGMQLHGPGDLFEVMRRPTSLLWLATLLCGAAGIWRLRRRAPLAAWTLGGATLACIALAGWGSHLPTLARLETARALVPATLLLVLPAGVALHAAAVIVQQAFGRTLTLLALLVACTVPPFVSLLDSRFFYVHRLDATLDPRATELLQTLDELAPRDARILFESTMSAQTELVDRMPLQALVPIYTRRELLGSPQPDMLPAQSQLEFGEGKLAGRPLLAWEPEEFAHFMELYNVGAAVAWSPEARAFLERQRVALRPAGDVHGFEIFDATQPGSYLLQGEAHVRADFDRIEIIEPRGDELVLKFHWVDGLRATPDVPIERATVPGDPVGFIRVRPQGYDHILLQPRR